MNEAPAFCPAPQGGTALEARGVAATLRLDSSSIRSVAALRSELTSRLDDDGAVSIDGSAVEKINTASLQLLAAFARELRVASRPLTWCGCSEALRRAVAMLGLSAVLGLAVSET